jgi:hypothetical protein
MSETKQAQPVSTAPSATSPSPSPNKKKKKSKSKPTNATAETADAIPPTLTPTPSTTSTKSGTKATGKADKRLPFGVGLQDYSPTGWLLGIEPINALIVSIRGHDIIVINLQWFLGLST